MCSLVDIKENEQSFLRNLGPHFTLHEGDVIRAPAHDHNWNKHAHMSANISTHIWKNLGTFPPKLPKEKSSPEPQTDPEQRQRGETFQMTRNSSLSTTFFAF